MLRNGDVDIVPSSFKHRFTTSADMNNFLRNIREVVMKYDSVENFANECIKKSEKEVGKEVYWLSNFAEALSKNSLPKSFPLISSPALGSPCKRLFLYLRWLIRSTDVDPGGWSSFKPSVLLIPCDTHMFRIADILQLTSRSSKDLRSVQLITSAFRTISPSDPAKYDFPLTRFGIRAGLPTTLY